MTEIITILGVVLGCMIIIASVFGGRYVWKKSTQLVTNSGTAGIPYTYFEDIHFNYENFCEHYAIDTIRIPSSFAGHQIPMDYIRVKDKKNTSRVEKNYQVLQNIKSIILVHGLGSNRHAMYPFAEMFLEKGFQVITYDQRNTNDNLAKSTTFGYWEKRDLIDCANYVQKSVTTEMIGVWGTSLGGATAGLAVAEKSMKEVIDFLILDCPLSSMEWAVKNGIQQRNLRIPTAYLMWCGNLMNYMKMRFTYKQADVAEAAKNIHVPTLIINSEADTVTPEFMGKSIYEAIPGEQKWIYTVKDSVHTEVFQQYPVPYKNHISDLISCAYKYKLEKKNIVQSRKAIEINTVEIKTECGNKEAELNTTEIKTECENKEIELNTTEIKTAEIKTECENKDRKQNQEVENTEKNLCKKSRKKARKEARKKDKTSVSEQTA